MYPWSSTFEQRDAVRNDLFLEYQTIKKKRWLSAYIFETTNPFRMRKMNSGQRNVYLEIESSVWKDVVRTDRKNEYFAGDDNPNLDVMKYEHKNIQFALRVQGHTDGVRCNASRNRLHPGNVRP